MTGKPPRPQWSETSPSKQGIRDWSPRNRENAERELHSASQYSRFVEMMKMALPVAALGTFAAIIIYSSIESDDGSISIVFDSMEQLENDLYMMNPVFTGFDKKSRPFRVEADKANQDLTNPDWMTLENLTGDLTVTQATAQSSGDQVSINADQGRFNSKSEKLFLNGHVILASKSNYRFETEKALVDLRSNRIEGDKAVRGQSTMGTVIADGFEVTQNGDLIKFIGNVKTKITPKKKQPPKKN